MKNINLKISLAITLYGLALTVNAALPKYTFTDLETLGGSTSTASAINNVGQVTGRSFTSGDSWNSATICNGTTATNLGGNFSAAINNAGQVAGITFFDVNDRATIWNGTTTTYLNSLGGNYSYAFGINDAGQVAGYSYLSGNNTRHATIWNGNIATDLGTLVGGYWSDAYAINNVGQVAVDPPLRQKAINTLRFGMAPLLPTLVHCRVGILVVPLPLMMLDRLLGGQTHQATKHALQSGITPQL